MKPPKLLIPFLIAVLAAAAGRAAPVSPPTVDISDRQGEALVRLALQAMAEYLLARTPADRQKVPAELADLTDTTCAAAVTLRSGGDVKAQIVRAGGNLPRNVIAAALKAMRSEKLPDRVTAAVLDSLTVEVEVLGAPQEAVKGDLGKLIRPGYTGLMAGRDARKTHVLPSIAYELGLEARGMETEALGQLGTLPGRWAVFTTSHFVGYPDRAIVRLRRGKISVEPGVIDEPALLAAAATVGEFLTRHQDTKTGRYGVPNGPAASLREHLHATYAIALLAARADGKGLDQSVNAALTHVVSSVSEEESRAFVAAKDPADRLAATAWLTMVVAGQPEGPQVRRLYEKLLAALAGALEKDEALSVGPEAEAPDTEVRKAGDLCLAYLALEPSLRDEAERVSRIRDLIRRKLRAAPMDAETFLWAARAGIISQSSSHWYDQVRKGIAPVVPIPDDEALPDESGGWRGERGPPATVLTARAALAIRDSDPREDRRPPENAEISNRLLPARSFCYRMVYRPREAFFAADPSDWVGGVRAGPAAAAVTVEACAAAVEALLAGAADPAASGASK